MKENILLKIEQLINEKKIDKAQLELSRLGQNYNNDANYLYLRGKVFYFNKLYYIAIDTLLIALEFEENDKIYNLIAEIYNILGNKELSRKLLDLNLRLETANSLKEKMSGIYKRVKKSTSMEN